MKIVQIIARWQMHLTKLSKAERAVLLEIARRHTFDRATFTHIYAGASQLPPNAASARVEADRFRDDLVWRGVIRDDRHNQFAVDTAPAEALLRYNTVQWGRWLAYRMLISTLVVLPIGAFNVVARMVADLPTAGAVARLYTFGVILALSYMQRQSRS